MIFRVFLIAIKNISRSSVGLASTVTSGRPPGRVLPLVGPCWRHANRRREAPRSCRQTWPCGRCPRNRWKQWVVRHQPTTAPHSGARRERSWALVWIDRPVRAARWATGVVVLKTDRCPATFPPAVEPVRLTPFLWAGWLGLWSGDQGPNGGAVVTGDAAAPPHPPPPPAAPAEQDRATKAIRRPRGGSPVPRPAGCHPGMRSAAAVVAREPRARPAAFRRGAPGAADRHRDQ